ncbi:MAG: hypothetical protein HOP95_00075 [Sphingomonas sp.]|nr:hypothetical protein [Sphingomonas sp.]
MRAALRLPRSLTKSSPARVYVSLVTRRTILSLPAITFALVAASFAVRPASTQEASISTAVHGAPLTVSVHPRIHAGAIDSLVFRGVQYVDNHDHGRQIQTAVQVDNLGECFNPTEAGSRADDASHGTSSVIRKLSASGNVLRTETQGAFWLSPGEAYGRACSPYRAETGAQNNSILSNYLIDRRTRFYGPSIPNLLIVDVSITFPETRQSASIEALTGYLPGSFRSFYSFDPQSRHLQPLAAGPEAGRTTEPVIIATPDGRNAMGVFSRSITGAHPDHAYYAYFYFPAGGATAKWSCVFGEAQIHAGATYHYSCPIAVGTLDEVTAAIAAYVEATTTGRR